jgi:hypothetical protein
LLFLNFINRGLSIHSIVHTDWKNSKGLLQDGLDEGKDGAAVITDGDVRQVAEDDVKLLSLFLGVV